MIIESRKLDCYRFPTYDEAEEFCRDNDIQVSNIKFDAEMDDYIILKDVLEGLSTKFSTKLEGELMGNSDKYNFRDVKKITDFVYDYVEKYCGGIVESKRIVKKEEVGYTTFKWKIQGIRESDKVTELSFSKTLRSRLSKYDFDEYGGKIGKNYCQIILPMDSDENGSMLGIECVSNYVYSYVAKEKVDKNLNGPTIIFILKVAIDENNMDINPDVEVDKNRNGSVYYNFTAPNFVAIFNSDSGEWSTRYREEGSYDTFNVVYKKGRNSKKVFDILNREYNKTMTRKDIEGILDKYLQTEHSWYFNPYID